MATKQASPEETQALLAEGYAYLDVRTEAEFQSGHPSGALNVPLSVPGPGGRVPNAEFVAVVERAFDKDAKLVVGCQSGARSRRAAEALVQAGFTNVVEMPAGFGGGRDEFGRPLPGWSQKGLPVVTGATPGHDYTDMKARKR